MTLAAENTEYVLLMRGVELVMSNPGSRDVPVSCIFTHDMFLDLRQELADQVLPSPASPQTRAFLMLSAFQHSAPAPPCLEGPYGPSRWGPADGRLRVQGMGGLDALEQVWRGDYMRRRAVSEFLRDKVCRRRKPARSRRLRRPSLLCWGV